MTDVMTTTTPSATLIVDQLREVTGLFEVSCGLPPLTKKVITTTQEINDEKGTQGDYNHGLLPASIIKVLEKWSNSARYMRKAHGGLQVGDRFMVPLSAMPAIQKDIIAKQAEIDKIVAYVEVNWQVVQNYVTQTLGPLNDDAVMLYGTAGGLETFKKHITFEAKVIPIPPSGVSMIPTAFAGQQQDAVLNHLQVQDAEFRKSICSSLTGDLRELQKRVEARIVWLNAGGTGTPPRPGISKRFVEGVQSRAALVDEISNGMVPEISKVCAQWAKIAPVLLDNLTTAMDSVGTCTSLHTSLTTLLADAGGS